jgi:hypothetical protein
MGIKGSNNFATIFWLTRSPGINFLGKLALLALRLVSVTAQEVAIWEACAKAIGIQVWKKPSKSLALRIKSPVSNRMKPTPPLHFPTERESERSKST